MREPLKDRNRLEHMLERIDFVLDAVKGTPMSSSATTRYGLPPYRMAHWLLAKPRICCQKSSKSRTQPRRGAKLRECATTLFTDIFKSGPI